MIDFTLAPEHEAIRLKVRDFIDNVIKPAMEPFGHRDDMAPEMHAEYVRELIGLRKKAVEVGLWLPHMPKEWGGMGLGHVALAMVQAEAAKTKDAAASEAAAELAAVADAVIDSALACLTA